MGQDSRGGDTVGKGVSELTVNGGPFGQDGDSTHHHILQVQDG